MKPILEEAILLSAAVRSQRPRVLTLSGTSWSSQPTLCLENSSSPLKLGSESFKPPGASSAGDVAFVSFSSGTTGAVKGVKLSHRNIVANTFQHWTVLKEDWGPRPVFALVFPLFHILGLGIFACQLILQVKIYRLYVLLFHFLADLTFHRDTHL